MKLDKILEFLIDAATVGAAGYLIYQSVKAMDEWIDSLCEDIKWEESYNETIKNLSTTVLGMNQEQWDFFYSRIAQRTNYDQNAKYILNIAASTLNSCQELDQLSHYSTDEALKIMIDVLNTKERGELQAFVYALDFMADKNIRVKALKGRFLRLIS